MSDQIYIKEYQIETEEYLVIVVGETFSWHENKEEAIKMAQEFQNMGLSNIDVYAVVNQNFVPNTVH